MTKGSGLSELKWALITGASGGIGYEFARQLAEQGRNVILVARRQDRLLQIANALAMKYGVGTHTIAADLSTKEGLEAVLCQTRNYWVDTLINNAGREESGPFLSLETADLIQSIALNCKAPLVLSHQLGKRMAEEGGGKILFVSSIVAFQGVPLIANYSATKAYLLTLAEGLAAEFAQHGVKISITAPGFTRTNLSPEISFKSVPFKPMTPEFVANYTLKRLGKQRLIIPGSMNKFLYWSGKFLQPRAINTRSFGLVFRRVLSQKLLKTGTKTSSAESAPEACRDQPK